MLLLIISQNLLFLPDPYVSHIAQKMRNVNYQFLYDHQGTDGYEKFFVQIFSFFSKNLMFTSIVIKFISLHQFGLSKILRFGKTFSFQRA